MYGPVLWVEGIIGSGKTTLTENLAKNLGLRPIFEPVASNPYLDLFYKYPRRWAFPMQIELLHRRFAMQKLAAFEAATAGGFRGAILDRGLPGDRVFARLHMLADNMSQLEWETYERAYDIMTCSLTPPSLLIFLDIEPDVALQRIKTRARGAEVGIDRKYLEDLRRGYLDLMVEIDSGDHAWSRGMKVMRLAWNTDHQPTDALIEKLRHDFRLGGPDGEISSTGGRPND
jgi:deoxyadenosine/deoxycytidine kinase